MASEEPPASSTAFRFSQTWRVSALIPPSMRRPVFGSIPSWPDAKTQSPILIACESGTRAGGTLSVCTTIRFIFDSPWTRRLWDPDARGTRSGHTDSRSVGAGTSGPTSHVRGCQGPTTLASDLAERVFPGQPTVCEFQDVDPTLASIAPVGQPHLVGPLGESVIANDHHRAGALAEHLIVEQHVVVAPPDRIAASERRARFGTDGSAVEDVVGHECHQAVDVALGPRLRKALPRLPILGA